MSKKSPPMVRIGRRRVRDVSKAVIKSDVALGYARYSTDAQDPLSITRQEENIKKTNKSNGLPPPIMFRDAARRGQTLDNSGMQALLAAMEKNPGASLTVESADRIFRSLLAFAHFQIAVIENHIRVYDWRGYVPPTQLPIEASISVLELEKFRMRGLKKMAELRDQGLLRQSKGYGYMLVENRHVPNPIQKRWVRKMFHLARFGVTPATIGGILDSHNVPTPRGAVRWNDNTVRDILTNPKYAGWTTYWSADEIPSEPDDENLD